MDILTKTIKKCFEKDRDHNVIITEDYIAGQTDVPDFKCDDFEIKNKIFTVFKTGDRKPVIDGATCAPDKIGPIDIAPAYVIHDLIYTHMEEIAKAWDWNIKDVRKWADDCLYCLIIDERNPFSKLIGRIYYSAVRLFGGIFHNRRFFIIIILIIAIIGHGCAGQNVITPIENPAYEVILK